MGLILMVLGFMWWWPLGLIILAALIANGRIGIPTSSAIRREWADGPRRTDCATVSEGIGGVNHQAAIVLSTTIAVRRCGPFW
jgi:hypothetical protein